MHLATISEMPAQLLAMLCNRKANVPPQPPPPKNGVFAMRLPVKGTRTRRIFQRKKETTVGVLSVCLSHPVIQRWSLTTPAALLQVAKNEQKTTMS